MENLSQRDTRWKNIQLGWSQVTIGSHGCTITAISMLIGTTPEKTNNRIMEVNGYAKSNLVIWSKLPEAYPEIKSATRYYSYDNDLVKQAIERNGGCLVKVDGSRIGADTHWVLYIGGGRMIDPWTGSEKSTSYYPAKGFTIIEITKKEDMPTDDEVRLARDRNWNGAMSLLTELNITDVTDDNFTAKVDEGVAEIKRLRSSRDGYKGEVTKAQNKVLELQETIKELENKKPEVSTFQRLTSRKWISSFSGIIVLLVSKYVGIDLDPADVALVVTPIIMFVSAEGFTDHVRMLSNQEPKQG